MLETLNDLLYMPAGPKWVFACHAVTKAMGELEDIKVIKRAPHKTYLAIGHRRYILHIRTDCLYSDPRIQRLKDR
jgi:hypothetical protein